MRLAKRPTPYPAASTAPLASTKRFVVVQVRQALQQTPTIGAWSPYFVAACVTRCVRTVFTEPASPTCTLESSTLARRHGGQAFVAIDRTSTALAVWRSHPGRLAGTAQIRRRRHSGKSGLPPGREAAHNVASACKAELNQRGGCEDGGAAVVAHQHDLLVEAPDVRIAPRALRVKPPFEHGARDVQ